MLRLGKRVEYALLAVHYLHTHTDGQPASVQQIADYYALPDDLLAKLMQTLKHAGVVVAEHGCQGGYRLAKQPRHMRLMEFVSLFSEHVAVTACTEMRSVACPRHPHCGIRAGMAELNDRLTRQFQELTVADVLLPSDAAASSGAVGHPDP